MLDKVGLEAIVGQYSCLLETVHSLPDFDHNVIVVDEWGGVVLVKNISRNILNWNRHVLVLRHGRVEIEVLNVDSEETRIGSGNNAVEQALYDSEIGGWS